MSRVGLHLARSTEEGSYPQSQRTQRQHREEVMRSPSGHASLTRPCLLGVLLRVLCDSVVSSCLLPLLTPCSAPRSPCGTPCASGENWRHCPRQTSPSSGRR